MAARPIIIDGILTSLGIYALLMDRYLMWDGLSVIVVKSRVNQQKTEAENSKSALLQIVEKSIQKCYGYLGVMDI